MSDTPTKSNYTPLLNRLSEMQESAYYATARADLLFAEQAIVCLERELSAKNDEITGGYKEKYLLLAAQHTREIEMILSVIEEISRKADGGLCSMTFGGARAFLTDIKEKCKEISELG